MFAAHSPSGPVRGRRRLSAGLGALTLAGTFVAGGPALANAQDPPDECEADGGVVTCVYGFTGDTREFTVPDGVTTLEVAAVGARGGDSFGLEEEGRTRVARGGSGATAASTVEVLGGATYFVEVGGRGADGLHQRAEFTGLGGYNGGGDGGALEGRKGLSSGGGGGGASDFRSGPSTASRLVVAAGGGGAGAAGGEGTGSYQNHGGDAGEAGAGGDSGGRAGTDSAGGPGGRGLIDLFPQYGEAGSEGLGGAGRYAEFSSMEFFLVGPGGGGGGLFGGGGGGIASGYRGGGGGGGSSLGDTLGIAGVDVAASVTITYHDPSWTGPAPEPCDGPLCELVGSLENLFGS